MQLCEQTLQIYLYFCLGNHRKLVEVSIFCTSQKKLLQIMKNNKKIQHELSKLIKNEKV